MTKRRYELLLAISFILFCKSLGSAQSLSYDDSIAVDNFLIKAFDFNRSKLYDSALFYGNQGADILKKNKVWKGYFRTRRALSNVYLRQSKFKEGLEDLVKTKEELLAISDQLGRRDRYFIAYLINEDLAPFYNKLRDYFSSIKTYQENIALTKEYVGLPDTLGNMARSYQNVATSYIEISDYYNAISHYDSALFVLRESFKYPTELEAVIYLNKARLMREFNFWEEALENLNHAKKVYKSMKVEDVNNYDRGYLYFAQSYFYSQRNSSNSDNMEARKYADSAYHYFRQNGRSKNFYPYLEYSYGESYKNDGEYDMALTHFNKAIDLNNVFYGQQYGELGYCYTTIGLLYQSKGQRDSAEYYFNKSIELYKSIDWVNKDEVAESYINLARFELERGNYVTALEVAQKGLKTMIPTTGDNVLSNPEANKLYPNVVLSKLLEIKAEICQKLIAERFDEAYAQCILDSYDRIISYSNTPLKEMVSMKSKSDSFEKEYTIFEKALTTSLSLYKETENPDYLLKALNYSELSKSNSLKKKILRKNLVKWNVPKEVLNKQTALVLRLNETKKQYALAAEESTTITSDIFKIKEELERLQNEIQRNYPAYHSVQFNNDLKLAEIKNAIPENSVLIEYFVGQDSIYTFVISSQIKTYTIPKKAVYDIEALLTSIENRSFDKKKAHLLFNDLLSTAISDSNIDQLIIIPDRQISLLPFEVLTMMNNDDTFNYLIEDYVIDYYPSISLLVNKRIKSGSDLNNLLAIAPQYSAVSNTLMATRSASDSISLTQLQPLPYAEMEVAQITDIFKGQKLIGERATEYNFKQQLRDMDMVHLAAHAILDDENPLYSKLVLASDSAEDGLLHVYELYGMDIKANLVSLSACNTGFGEYYGGEGVISLARGFMQAGVPNVLMSLWSVPDKSTSELMTSFYTHLKDGDNKSSALRKAKMDYLNKADDLTSQPYYWAGFVIMTDLEEDTDSYNFWWLIGAVFLLVIAFIIVKNQSTKTNT